MKEDEDDAAPGNARDAAIDWLMRINERALSEDEAKAFSAWLAADSANMAAYDDISEMFGALTSMSLRATPAERTAPAQRTKRAWAAAGAASLMAASIALFLFFDETSLFLRSDHYAGPGEKKQATLDDGSRIELAAKSAIAVRFGAGERRLTLLGGEAWFEVAPDPLRPFIVEAAGGSVTALGTAFDVAVDRGGAHVTVAEHRVLVASDGHEVVVEQGQQSAIARHLVEPPTLSNVERATAWRRGKLIFDDKPLDEVVEALERYWRGHVYFADATLRSRRVTGVFGASDPLLALEEIETALGIHAISLSNYLIILY
jgi:transmembrane sensor